MKNKSNFLGIPRKQGNLLMFLALLVLIVPSFFYDGLIETYWPYLIMMLVLLLMNNVNDTKFGVSLLITFLVFMFIMQSLFYFILPVYHNYQPTPTIPGKMQIFDLAGKFQISYYPDIPKGGDNIQLYFKICDVGLTNCNICEVCSLTLYFIDEKGDKNIIYQNKSTNSTEPIQFSYPGREVKVELDFEGIDSRYKVFFIPKLSFYQSTVYFFSENSFFRIVSIISLIIFFISFPYSLYKLSILIRKKLRIFSENKYKNQIEKILCKIKN